MKKILFCYAFIIFSISSCIGVRDSTDKNNYFLIEKVVNNSLDGLLNQWRECYEVDISGFNSIIYNSEFGGYGGIDSIFMGSVNINLINYDGTINKGNLGKEHKVYDIPFYYKYDYTEKVEADYTSINVNKYLINNKEKYDGVKFWFSSVFKQKEGYLLVFENEGLSNYPSNRFFIYLNNDIEIIEIKKDIDWCK